MMSVLDEIADNLIKGKADEVKKLVTSELDNGTSAADVLNNGLLKGMNVVGERFKKNEIYVPEVLIAARAMKAGMEPLRPKLVESGVEPIGTVVIATVKGDLHDIGKNLVCMMLEGAGFMVYDAGINIEAEKLVEIAQEKKANIIGASALLTTTMTKMKDVVQAVNSSELKGAVKLMIGGAPVTQAYADEIGADAYAPDAASAADIAKQLVS
jgi:5-methyltetrahydrofolate--homocysteine methyltransferase